jgi:hypothetical protein
MACWDGYVQKGMKKKNGRMVPNCVPSMKQGGLTKWFQEKWVDIGARKKRPSFVKTFAKKSEGGMIDYYKGIL